MISAVCTKEPAQLRLVSVLNQPAFAACTSNKRKTQTKCSCTCTQRKDTLTTLSAEFSKLNFERIPGIPILNCPVCICSFQHLVFVKSIFTATILKLKMLTNSVSFPFLSTKHVIRTQRSWTKGNGKSCFPVEIKTCPVMKWKVEATWK